MLLTPDDLPAADSPAAIAREKRVAVLLQALAKLDALNA